MSQYSPEYAAGRIPVTGTCSSAVTGGEVLVVTGSGTLGASSAATVATVGVALSDGAASGDVTYLPRGPIHLGVASGSITAGNQLVAAVGGRVAALAVATGNAAADINNARYVIGVALTTADDNASVQWMQI